METNTQLILERERILKKLETIFANKAIEAHIFGSIARQQTDAFSDIDIWFTFKDEDYNEVLKRRFEYYELLGEIIHSCEAPQNAPNGGVYTALLIQSQGLITVVDMYLCPLSTAYIINEGKKLFGIDLPKTDNPGFNPQKVQLHDGYRIDFFICFIFNTIKKIARQQTTPLEAVLYEYEKLHTTYDVLAEPLDTKNQDIITLEKIIENTKKISTDKQTKTLEIIQSFIKKVL